MGSWGNCEAMGMTGGRRGGEQDIQGSRGMTGGTAGEWMVHWGMTVCLLVGMSEESGVDQGAFRWD